LEVLSFLGTMFSFLSLEEEEACKQTSSRLRDELSEYYKETFTDDKALCGAVPVELDLEVCERHKVYPNARLVREGGQTTVVAAPMEVSDGTYRGGTLSRARHYDWSVTTNIHEMERAQDMVKFRYAPAECTPMQPMRKMDDTSLHVYESALLDRLYDKTDQVCVVNPSQGTLYRLAHRDFVILRTDDKWDSWYKEMALKIGIQLKFVDRYNGTCYLGSNGVNRTGFKDWCALTPNFLSDRFPYENYSIVKDGADYVVSYEKNGVARDIRVFAETQWHRMSPTQVDHWLNVTGKQFFVESSWQPQCPFPDEKAFPVYFVPDGPYQKVDINGDKYYVKGDLVIDMVSSVGTSLARRHFIKAKLSNTNYHLAPLSDYGYTGFAWTSSAPAVSEVYTDGVGMSELGKVAFISNPSQLPLPSVIMISQDGLGNVHKFLPGLVAREVAYDRARTAIYGLSRPNSKYYIVGDIVGAGLSQLRILEFFFGATIHSGLCYADRPLVEYGVEDLLDYYRFQPCVTDLRSLYGAKELVPHYERGKTASVVRSSIFQSRSFVVSNYECTPVALNALAQYFARPDEDFDHNVYMRGPVWVYPFDKLKIDVGGGWGMLSELLLHLLNSCATRCSTVHDAVKLQRISAIFLARYMTIMKDNEGYYVTRLSPGLVTE